MTNITSPMPGRVLDIKVSVGQQVYEGQELIMMESMKMEMPIISTANGTVKSICANVNDAVLGNSILVVVE